MSMIGMRMGRGEGEDREENRSGMVEDRWWMRMRRIGKGTEDEDRCVFLTETGWEGR